MSRDDAVRAAAEATDSRARAYGLNGIEHQSLVEVAVDAAAPHLTADLVRERDEALAEVERLRYFESDLAYARAAGEAYRRRAEKAEAEVDRLRGLLDGPDCTCGYGGYHEETNPRCARNALRGES